MPTLSPHETKRADALWRALEALAPVAQEDESQYVAEPRLLTAWETLHDAYEDLTGYCFGDERDRRTYTTDAAHAAALAAIPPGTFED